MDITKNKPIWNTYIISAIILCFVLIYNILRTPVKDESVIFYFVFAYIILFLPTFLILFLFTKFIQCKITNYKIHLISCILYIIISYAVTYWVFIYRLKPETEISFCKRMSTIYEKNKLITEIKLKSSYITKPQKNIIDRDSVAIFKRFYCAIDSLDKIIYNYDIEIKDTLSIKTSLNIRILTYSPDYSVLVAIVVYNKKINDNYDKKDWINTYSFSKSFFGVKRENGIYLYLITHSDKYLNQELAYFGTINNIIDLESNTFSYEFSHKSVLSKEFWNSKLFEKVMINKDSLYNFEVYEDLNSKTETRKRFYYTLAEY